MLALKSRALGKKSVLLFLQSERYSQRKLLYARQKEQWFCFVLEGFSAALYHVLELTLQAPPNPSWPGNQEITCLCLPTAVIKGIYHHWQVRKKFLDVWLLVGFSSFSGLPDSYTSMCRTDCTDKVRPKTWKKL